MVGDSFEILQAAQVEGAFDQIDTDGDYIVEVAYGVTSVTVTFVSLVAAEKLDDLPAALSLEQNYPNPFNPSTVISFDVPFSQRVSIRVFDMLGRQVAVLVDKPIEAGRHSIVFDGVSFPSGLYIYRLDTSTGSHSRKMVLLK